MYPVKILNIKQLTHDVKSFTVTRPDNYQFTPGQATEIFGHPFTFTSLNSDSNLEFIIKTYPVSQYPTHKGVTEKLHKLNVGDEWLIGDPWGTIQYKGPGMFLAAGAGVTPFIAIFRDLHSQNKLANNKLIFSNKTSEDIILRDEFEKIFPKNNFINTLTREQNPEFEHGHIDENFLKKHVNNFSQHFYLCGPKPFVSSMKEILSNLDASTESLVFEE